MSLYHKLATIKSFEADNELMPEMSLWNYLWWPSYIFNLCTGLASYPGKSSNTSSHLLPPEETRIISSWMGHLAWAQTMLVLNVKHNFLITIILTAFDLLFWSSACRRDVLVHSWTKHWIMKPNLWQKQIALKQNDGLLFFMSAVNCLTCKNVFT